VARPSTADIEDCNRVASESHGSRTRDVLTDAVIGGAAGAALGAAAGSSQPAYGYQQPAYGYQQPAYGYQPSYGYR
jgi:hypothetical protein